MKTAKLPLTRVAWPPRGHYVVAVSGGVDSVALLHLLATHNKKTWRLRVAHIDHGLRPDSRLDHQLARDLARIYDLPFHSLQTSLGRADEATSRSARYKFLQELARRYGADGIITAHHFDDRQETSFFNVLRGAGRVGVAPMNQRTEDGGRRTEDGGPRAEDGQRIAGSEVRIANSEPGVPVVRPLLRLRKAELVRYAASHGLPWREDTTNRELIYDRNFIRHELLARLGPERAGFDRAYEQLVSRLDRLNAQIDHRLAGLLPAGSQNKAGIGLPRQQLFQLGSAQLEELLALVLRRLSPDLQLSQKLVQQLARFTKTAGSGQQKSLPGELNVVVGYDRVTITLGQPATPSPPPACRLYPNSSVRFGRYELTSGLSSNQTNLVWLRSADLVRSYQPGDRIAPIGMDGTKKLHDLFTDAKLPRGLRLHHPVVTSQSGQVVWVPGLAVSRDFTAPAADPSAQAVSFALI